MASKLARATATAIHKWTPSFLSNPLSERLGCAVWVKMDAMQPSGSFKLRGLGNAVANAAARGVTSVVSSSGGNAGLATAYACRELGLKLTLFVPETTPDTVIHMLEGYGAAPIVHGRAWDDANRRALQEAAETGAELIHPFDQPDVWDGNATVVHELAHDMPVKPDALVTVCGGGGLAMGILQGLEEVGWESVRVLVCETVGAESLSASLSAGELVTLPEIASVATSLGARTVSERMFNKCLSLGEPKVSSWVTTDAAAVRACATFLDDHRVLVEPACGAALASVYERVEQLRGLDNVIVQVCGGALMNQDRLARLKAELGVQGHF